MTYRQAPPFSMQIEATEGCNLRCGFCGIRGIREKGTTGELSGPFHFMTVTTARSLASQLRQMDWNCRLEFAMHGEPTMNPDLPEIIHEFRAARPRSSIMVTTNGIPMLKSLKARVHELFAAGVNTIAVDDYAPHRVAPALRELMPVIEYPADRNGNPHVRFHGQRVVIVADIAQAETGTHATLNNHAGSAAPPTDRMVTKVCTLPFRELSVRFDGSIALCCNDWRGQYRVGDAADLDAAWHGPEMTAARRLLLHEGRRDITPCAGCDYRGTRVGLLPQPDGGGKDELGPVTDADRAVARDLSRAPTLTPVVLRRWEVSAGAAESRAADAGCP